jgi:hypothetical protein
LRIQENSVRNLNTTNVSYIGSVTKWYFTLH